MKDSRASRFRFHGDWEVAAPPPAVYAVLNRPEDYPRWWPQVREVVRTGPDTGHCRFRSFLPFDLHVTVRATRREPAAGVLEIALSGDLDGWLRWTLIPLEGGTRVRHEQDTALRKPLLRRLAPVARPAFAANHAVMMRAGHRGLRAWLGVHLDDG
ncbi:SRPBCC family protein [Streptomyces litchfieldiae]|uniref:SRPBCC family protein n=1 Tax=Streptomyces litchfieldiae TaxID=3075543 RepID=A0ABU2MYF6_9ACTN|nr:SRPBCC family protein [Streptomyces sp. DSM 44938]MDT0345579.1 SRPBCC family protein [Streptomyces sp. DSM 44938]